MSIVLLFLNCLITPLLKTNEIVHEFHLSKCEMQYNFEENSMQVSLHVFIDDLESALKAQGIDSLYICTPRENPEAELHIINYIRKNFSLSYKKENFDFEFVGKEVSSDLSAVWCYFEFPTIPIDRELEISNSILIEMFDDQKNITSVRISNSRQKHFLFGKGETTGIIPAS